MSNGDNQQVDTTQPGWSLRGPTPAPTPSSTGSDPNQSPAMRQLMDAMAQQTMRPRSVLPQPRPNEPTRISSASGFLPLLFMGIQNAYAAHKEKQIKAAMGLYSGLQAAHEKAEMNSGGDPQKTAELFHSDPYVQEALMGKNGEKNLKQMKELLNVDFMNPEANQTAHHEGLKRVLASVGPQKVMRMVQTALSQHKQSQAQATPEQDLAQAKQRADMVGSRAMPQPMDVKSGTEIAKGSAELQTAHANLTKAQADLLKEQTLARDTYSPPVVTKSGEVVVYDKRDPTKTVTLHGEDGKPVSGQLKPGMAPKVLFSENIPYAVLRDGKPIMPGDPEWTANDQKLFSAASSATAAGEANKAKLAATRQTFFSSLPQAVLMKTDDPVKGTKAGELGFVTRQEAAAHPERYAPVGAGDKAMGTRARFGEIQKTVDGTNAAISNLPDTGFNAKARAQLAYVMRSPNPQSAIDNFMKSEIAGTLTDAQMDYVQWLASLSESAQALTSLQGIGARGSDQLRTRIAAMLPGPSTPSRKYAEGQMQKFQIELDALLKGVPGLGALDQGTHTDESGATIIDLRRKK